MSEKLKNRVGIIRDDRFLEHRTGHVHPEHPNRLKAIYRMLDTDFSDGLLRIEAEPATLEQLELVHTPSYIEKVLKTADHTFSSLAPDTPTSAKTYEAAWLAVGACLKGLDTMLSGQCDVCLSLIRPPGHHALPDRGGGFCIFNNLGVTARYAMGEHGLRRILIIDWDTHHGNGLHDLFYGEKEVLYFSSHDIGLYPYGGDWEETGEKDGQGYTINLPVPRELADQEFLHLYQEILGPVFRRYNPELVLIAAGFDSLHDDPVGRSRLTEMAFRGLTRLILELSAECERPPILFALEGGYDPSALSRSVKGVLEVLTETDHEGRFEGVETEQIRKLLEKARRIHSKFGVWVD
jgi:acetoin utilization deacetylase AcuC-like enzyme